MTEKELEEKLDQLGEPVMDFLMQCVKGKPPRNAQVIFGVAKLYLDRKLPPIQRSEISGIKGGPLQSKITIEIVRPLAVTDAEDTRKARIPSRTIDAA